MIIAIFPAVIGLILGVTLGVTTLAPPLEKLFLALLTISFCALSYGLPVYLLTLKLITPKEYSMKELKKMKAPKSIHA